MKGQKHERVLTLLTQGLLEVSRHDAWEAHDLVTYFLESTEYPPKVAFTGERFECPETWGETSFLTALLREGRKDLCALFAKHTGDLLEEARDQLEGMGT